MGCYDYEGRFSPPYNTTDAAEHTHNNISKGGVQTVFACRFGEWMLRP